MKAKYLEVMCIDFDDAMIEQERIDNLIHKCKIQTILKRSKIILFKAVDIESEFDEYKNINLEYAIKKRDFKTYVIRHDNNIKSITEGKVNIFSVSTTHKHIINEIVRNRIPFFINLLKDETDTGYIIK